MKKIEKEKILSELIPHLSDQQKKVVDLASSGMTFRTALKRAGYNKQNVSRIFHNRPPYDKPTSRIQKVKNLFDDSYAVFSKKIKLTGAKCAERLGRILDDPKASNFDAIHAIKEHHRIISQTTLSQPQVALQAQNVLILGSRQSIKEFNNADNGTIQADTEKADASSSMRE